MQADEEVLLGQVFIDNAVFYKIGLQPNDFESQQCRSLFQTMQHLSDKSLSIDYVTVHSENPQLNMGWFSALSDKVNSAANFEHFQTRIKEASNKRKLALLGLMISDNLKQGKKSAEVKELIETELTNLATASRGWEIKHITPVLMEAMETIEERYKLKGKLPGIQTGFSSLNDLILGFRPRMLYLFGARPSRGKTALMLNMAVSAASSHKVGIINTESANQEMGMRIISSHSGINSQAIASGYLKSTDFGRLMTTTEQLSDKGLYFYDEPNASLSTVIAKCREMVRKDKVTCIFLDYVQNVYYNEKGTERENLGYISTQLKATARSLNVPIVAMAQLRREGDQAYKRPVMSDLLGSGKLEQDADVIGLIWWQLENASEVKDGNEPEFKEWVLIDKNRDGMTGAVRVKFNKETVKFTEVEND